MNIFYMSMDPVALSLGPIVIRWYALAYLAGFILGWRYCLGLVSDDENVKPNKDNIDDFLTWAIIGVILGGRLGYVFFYNFNYYMDNPMDILKVWQGGMSFHGGMLGVMVSMIAYASFKKINVFKLSDVICAAAPIGLFFGRIANFINGELYGMKTNGSWGVVFQDSGIAPRHPSQLYEAFLEGIVLFVFLRILMKHPNVKTGTVTGVFLLGYGLFRALVEFVREPDPQLGLIWDMVSMGQILCMPMIIGGVILVMFASLGRLGNEKNA